jgi:hypothetical protein
VRLGEHPNKGVNLIYKKSSEPGEYVVVALANYEQGRITYYRRNHQPDPDTKGELKPSQPVNDLVVLVIKVSLEPVGAELVISIEYRTHPSSVYVSAQDSVISGPLTDVVLPAPNFARDSVLKALHQRLTSLLIGTDGAAAQEILSVMINLDLIAKENSFLSDNILNVSADIGSTIQAMRAVYRFMLSQHNSNGLYSYQVTPLGVATTVSKRGEKWLAVWNMLLNAAVVIADSLLIWGFPDVVPVTDGDVFFYLNPTNPQVMRAAILTIYAFTIAWAVKELTNYAFQLTAQFIFSRKLLNLPSNLSQAVISSSVASSFFADKVYAALSHLSPNEGFRVKEVSDFMEGLKQFAGFCSHSGALPVRLRLELMNLGSSIVNEIMKGSQETGKLEEAILNRIRDSEKTVLKGVFAVTGVSAAAAAVFAGIYYELINTGEGDEALSALTTHGLYALGVAALYLLYKFGGSVAEAGLALYVNRHVGFFASRRDAVVDVVSDAEPRRRAIQQPTVLAINNSASVRDDETQPLMPARQRHGRGCPWPSSCTIS